MKERKKNRKRFKVVNYGSCEIYCSQTTTTETLNASKVHKQKYKCPQLWQCVHHLFGWPVKCSQTHTHTTQFSIECWDTFHSLSLSLFWLFDIFFSFCNGYCYCCLFEKVQFIYSFRNFFGALHNTSIAPIQLGINNRLKSYYCFRIDNMAAIR